MHKNKIITIVIPFLLGVISVYSQPAILSHPSDTSVCSGVNVEFSITASNAEYFQWQEYDGTGWFDIDENITYADGENTPNLVLNDVITGLNNYEYRCYVEDENGDFALSNSASLNVYSPPLITDHPQNKEVCKNQTASFSVNTENATNYQWQENRGDGWYNIQDNAFYSGTTSEILQVFTIFGIDDYLYRCKVYNNSCFDFSNEAFLEVNSLPQVYYVYGGGQVCENGQGANIFLNNSETGVNYELIKDSNTTVAVREGTGQEIDFGTYAAEGSYTVRGVNENTACQNNMNGQAVIEVLPTPQSFNLISEGVICEGSDGTTILLENSETGIQYSLFLGGNATGYQLIGTGGPLNFENISIPGSYSVLATDINSGCESYMNNTIELEEAPSPQVFTLTGDEVYCEGSTGAQMQLSGSENDITYALIRDGQFEEQSIQGTGDELIFSNITTPGAYEVLAVVAEAGCETMMDGNIQLSSSEAPQQFELSGTEFLCTGENGIIELSGSQQQTEYELIRDDNPTGIVQTGTGQSFYFTIETPGTYEIKATDTETGCTGFMQNQLLIESANAPIADAGQDQQIEPGSTATLQGSASGGTGSYDFFWEPEAMLQSNNIAEPQTVALENPQLYTLEVTDQLSNCKSSRDSVWISIEGGEFTVQAYTADDSLCSGHQTQLYALVQGGSGNYTYQWYTEEGTFSSDLNNPVVSPESTTHYIIRVDDGNTLAEDTVTIHVTPSPQIFNLSGDAGFCEGSQGAMLSLSGFQQNVSYEIMRNGQPYGFLADSAAFLVNHPGTYSVSAQANQCSVMMNGSPEVALYETPVANAGEDRFVYAGESTQLSGSAISEAEVTYSWQPENYVENPASATTQTLPLHSNAEFQLTVTSTETGCTSTTDTVAVDVVGDSFTVNAASGTSSLCAGEAVTLVASANGGSGQYNYLWESNPPGFSSTDSAALVYPESPSWFIVTVSDGYESIKDSVFIDVHEAPEIMTLNGGDGICSNSPGTEITLNNSEEGSYYTLYHENETLVNAVSGTGNPISFGTVYEEGTYYAVATDTATSCASIMAGESVIFHYETPQAYAGEDDVIESNSTTQLNGFGTGGSGLYNYFWSPTSMVENAGAPSTSTVNLTSSTIFQLQINDQVTGCTSEADSVLVSVSGGNLTLSLQSNVSTVCSGTEVSLIALAGGGSGNYSYNWSSEPPGINTQGYTASHKPDTTTIYTVLVDDGENTIEKSVEVQVESTPEVSAGENQEIAFGDKASLSGTVEGGSEDYSYQWKPEGLIESDNDNANAQTTALYQNTSFTFHATDNSTGCQSIPDTTMITVTGSNLSAKAIASSKNICSGESITITALTQNTLGEISYQWTSENGNISENSPLFTHEFSESTDIYLEVSDQKGIAYDTISIETTPSPESLVLTGDGNYCEGEAGATLQLINTENRVSYQLIRNQVFTGMSIDGNGNEVRFDDLRQEGVYTVMAVDKQNDCRKTMNGAKTVAENPLPHLFTMEGGGNYCENEFVTFSLTGSVPGVSYTLMTGDELIDSLEGNGNSLEVSVPARNGTFSMIATDTTSGCSRQMEGEAMVNTHPLPDLTVSADTTIFKGSTVILTASGAENYLWNTTPESTQPSVEVSPQSTTTYTVTGRNEYECETTASVTVTVDESTAPETNAFTPNDDGVNDIFMQGYDIVIINRWGNKLYEGNEGWDGSYEGKKVPAGTYYYIRKTDASGNEVKPVKGSVTVIRKQN
ncbi:MAG: gliding motility-associated C-terminal domain-containing protein [Bacteroidota bacterium]